MTSIYWLIAFVVLLGIEVATMALTTIWFAGGALAAFVLSLLGVGVEAQLVVFVVVSFVLLFFTRPFAARYVNKKTTKTNVDSLIGKQVRITVEVNNGLSTGAAVMNGQEWTARSMRDNKVFAVGDTVTVKEISGVKLIVDEMKEGV